MLVYPLVIAFAFCEAKQFLVLKTNVEFKTVKNKLLLKFNVATLECVGHSTYSISWCCNPKNEKLSKI